MSKILKGSVSWYDRLKGGGEVELDSGEKVPFKNGTFDSGWPVRPPKEGDKVTLRFVNEKPLYIRLVK